MGEMVEESRDVSGVSQPGRLLVEDRREGLRRCRLRERIPAGDHLVEKDDSEREEIARRRRLLRADLLGSDVSDRAERSVGPELGGGLSDL